MGFAAERQAIEEKIKLSSAGGTWGLDPKYIGFPNSPIEDPGQNLHIKVNFVNGDEEDIEIGRPTLRRYINVLMIQIFQPQNTGTRQALAIADIVEATFRDLVLTAGAGKIRFYTPKVRDLGDEEEGYYQINVECPYKLDERK